MNLKSHIELYTLIVGDLNTPLSSKNKSSSMETKQRNIVINKHCDSNGSTTIVTGHFTQTQKNIPSQQVIEPSSKLTAYSSVKQD